MYLTMNRTLPLRMMHNAMRQKKARVVPPRASTLRDGPTPGQRAQGHQAGEGACPRPQRLPARTSIREAIDTLRPTRPGTTLPKPSGVIRLRGRASKRTVPDSITAQVLGEQTGHRERREGAEQTCNPYETYPLPIQKMIYPTA